MTYQLDPDADWTLLPDAVRKGIRESDPADVGSRNWQTISLSLRDSQGATVGRLYGVTMWSWLMIDGLWVAPRGAGTGARSAVAYRQRGVCHPARLHWFLAGHLRLSGKGLLSAARLLRLRGVARFSSESYALPSSKVFFSVPINGYSHAITNAAEPSLHRTATGIAVAPSGESTRPWLSVSSFR